MARNRACANSPGLGAARTDYGQTAIVAMVSTARPHEHTAWQRFLGDGTLAFLPLKDAHSSIVWSVPTARAERLLAATAEVFERELESDFDGALGKVRLVSERVKFPLWRLSANAYVTARVALVGDAAHVVHPLAGQGANLGLLDAAALADVLAEGVRSREDPGAERILRRYERWRRSENDLMSGAIDAFDRLLARGTGRIAELAQRGMPLGRPFRPGKADVHRARHGARRRTAGRGALTRSHGRTETAPPGGHGGDARGRRGVLVHGRGAQAADGPLSVRRRWRRCAGSSALPLVFIWAMYAGGATQLVRVRWPLHLIRGVLSVFMMISFTFALKELSLAKTYALFFIAPLLIAILSTFMLGERVRRTQWVAIVVGFAGVLIVLKPGAVGFGWAGTLAVLGTAFCYALSSVLVKIIGRTDTTQAMVFWMTCMLAIGATAIALPGWQPILEEHYLDHRRSRDHRRHRAMGHHRSVQARAGGQRGATRIFGPRLGDPDRLFRLVGDARMADAGGRRRDHRQRSVPASFRGAAFKLGAGENGDIPHLLAKGTRLKEARLFLLNRTTNRDAGRMRK